MTTVTIDGQEYDVYPPSAVAASKIISDMYEKLGKPDSPMSDAGEKMMKIIIAVWEDLYPQEARAWRAKMAEYKREELSISEQVSKKTGRSLASVPYPVYSMMKKVFPAYKLDHRDSWMKFVKRYPLFRAANRA